jgi:thymidine kinase
MIELILGPMFSGKSSELLRKVRRFEVAKKRCLVINYTHDNRYSNEDVMSTHDK